MSLKILHCVEYYHPSPGGAQAVVRRISEQLVQRGHEVTVATTRLPERREYESAGVRIEEFDVSGNAVRGIEGEAERYLELARDPGFDVVMTYAAQQWTTDAMLPALDEIPACTVLAPCGFSGLRDPAYAGYFAELPAALARFDALVFHSGTYQDAEFAREHGLSNGTVIPNGAAREEFEDPGSGFRERHGIGAQTPLLLTVGPHNWRKGHALVIEAFGRSSAVEEGVLAVIGNRPLRLGCQWDCARRALGTRLRTRGHKRVRLLDLPREEVVTAFKASDVFLLGSEIECSPLVLFEAAAAGTPFVSSDAGNAAEIAAWTGAGEVVPGRPLDDGRIRTPSDAFAETIDKLWRDPERRLKMAERGRSSWLREFTWEGLAARYETLYRDIRAA